MPSLISLKCPKTEHTAFATQSHIVVFFYVSILLFYEKREKVTLTSDLVRHIKLLQSPPQFYEGFHIVQLIQSYEYLVILYSESANVEYPVGFLW